VDKFALKAKGFIDIDDQNIQLHENELLLIDKDRIIGFISKSELSSEFDEIDLGEVFVLPGLIDVSFLPQLMFDDAGSSPENYGESVWRSKDALMSWLQSGVTTAGTMG